MNRWKILIVGAVAIATAVLTAAAFARTAAVASMAVGQTCSERIAPGTQASVNATVRNDGDEVLQQIVVDGDAGTGENPADDFILARTGSEENELLEPGETWTFAGSYRVGNEDSVNVVHAEGTSLDGDPADDLEACPTDVIQPPVPGVRAGVAPTRGKVMVKVPGSTAFVELDGTTEIPMGTQVDTRKGAVRLVSGAAGSSQSAAGATQSAVFFDGLFTIRQARGARAVMTLILGGGNFGVCRRSGARRRSQSARSPRRRYVGSGAAARAASRRGLATARRPCAGPAG